MHTILTMKTWLNKILSGVVAALLAFMSLLAVYQVFMRYIMKNPSTMSEDILSYSFVWISLIATALVFGERDHMNLTFFLDKGSPVVKLILSLLSEALVIIIAFMVFLVGGNKFMNVGAIQVSPTLGITMDLVYLILPVSGILIILFSVINMIELVASFKSKEER
ncbi:MAG: TRAP transporter small permease [Oscillospiraceae bacterium]